MTATSRDLQPEPGLSQRLPAHVADVRSAMIDHLDATELATLTAVADRVQYLVFGTPARTVHGVVPCVDGAITATRPA